MDDKELERKMDMIDDTRDIRITRLEGLVQVLVDTQGAMLDKMDVLIANQSELKANQVRIIELIQALALDVADLKDRIIGRPMGFVLPEDDDS